VGAHGEGDGPPVLFRWKLAAPGNGEGFATAWGFFGHNQGGAVGSFHPSLLIGLSRSGWRWVPSSSHYTTFLPPSQGIRGAFSAPPLTRRHLATSRPHHCMIG